MPHPPGWKPSQASMSEQVAIVAGQISQTMGCSAVLSAHEPVPAGRCVSEVEDGIVRHQHTADGSEWRANVNSMNRTHRQGGRATTHLFVQCSHRSESQHGLGHPPDPMRRTWSPIRPAFSSGGSGIRTHGALRHNGFRDRPIRPLSHPSSWTFAVSLTIPVLILAVWLRPVRRRMMMIHARSSSSARKANLGSSGGAPSSALSFLTGRAVLSELYR